MGGYLKVCKTVEALSEEHQISPANLYKFKNEVEMEKNEDKKQLKRPEMENLWLKKTYLKLHFKQEEEFEAVDILKKMKADQKRLLDQCYKTYNFEISHSNFKTKALAAI